MITSTVIRQVSEKNGYKSQPQTKDPVQIRLLNQHDFDVMEVEWNELLSQSRANNIFLRWEWVHTWWLNFRSQRILCIAEARQDGRLVGIGPLYLERNGDARLNELRFCSDELSPDYLEFILDKEHEADILPNLLTFIMHNSPYWDVLSLDNVRSDSLLITEPSLIKNLSSYRKVSQRCPFVRISEG